MAVENRGNSGSFVSPTLFLVAEDSGEKDLGSNSSRDAVG